jgi:hypothetical protein
VARSRCAVNELARRDAVGDKVAAKAGQVVRVQVEEDRLFVGLIGASASATMSRAAWQRSEAQTGRPAGACCCPVRSRAVRNQAIERSTSARGRNGTRWVTAEGAGGGGLARGAVVCGRRLAGVVLEPDDAPVSVHGGHEPDGPLAGQVGVVEAQEHAVVDDAGLVAARSPWPPQRHARVLRQTAKPSADLAPTALGARSLAWKTVQLSSFPCRPARVKLAEPRATVVGPSPTM